MGTKVKNETREATTMAAADYRRRIIRMVSADNCGVKGGKQA